MSRQALRDGWWLYAVFFLLTGSQVLPLTAISLLLNRDLGLEAGAYTRSLQSST